MVDTCKWPTTSGSCPLALGHKLTCRLDLGGETLSVFGQGTEVTFHLQTVPELGGLVEERAEANGHGRRDGAFAENDLVDGARGHANGSGHGVLGDTHGNEVLLKENFAEGDLALHVSGRTPRASWEK